MNPALSPDVRPFFARPRSVFLVATLCCLLWGSSYPSIKSGYELLAIAQHDVPSKLIFAGYRFLIAGLCLVLLAIALRKPALRLTGRQLGQLTMLGLAQTGLQYVFFYIGLAYTTGVRASILNATTTFFSVLLAHFIYRNDRLSPRKAAGCLLGFAGVVAVNLGSGGFDIAFTWQGEGFIVIAAFVLSAASIYGKHVSGGMDAMVMTGWQLAIGGAALLAGGYATGGTIGNMTFAPALLLAYLALLSAVAFTLWSLLLKHNPVGTVSVFAFLIPVFGAALSALFLDESILEWKNLVALLLVCAGIWLVTRPPR
ncbi:DMT family transporter [Pseudoduganella umbonata]|uniref:DMT family transporter n=1 Tax=Pseudoduganella umbonata TaxID=864828 RepID=A0A4V1ED87_9BURK|nr:DMT family transporter [Pseudoduganella umbonata]MBB3221016.1 drug/metabolite transporter (DMT)-like permease [Pseudoduganella umbonata]QCP10221.1 DMT family transporter [Pseudoduganella umbonata]